jgi:hypothetical protein
VGQAVAQANVLSDEMSRFQKARQNVPAPLNGQFYREFETIACIYPTLRTDSKIEITTFKAKLVGFDDLASTIASQKKARSWLVSDWERLNPSIRLNTDISWLRMEAVRMLSFLHCRASLLGEHEITRVRELLQSFETRDLLVNPEILRTC